MKKSVMILSFMLAFVMLCCIFTTKEPNKLVRASSKEVNNQTIIVVGKGEIEVEPDMVQINFGLKTRADSLQSGQTKIKESFDNVVSKLKQVDAKSSVYIYYSASYPVSDGGLLAYEFDYGLTAKSTKIDKANDLVNTIISAGATSVHNTSFTLQNKEENYIQALVKARDNADQKVKAMYSDAKLIGLREENCYSCCESSRGEKIKVCAKVKAFYEVGSLTENTSTTTQTNLGTSQTTNSVNNTNKLTNNKTENTTINSENINNNTTERVEEKQETLEAKKQTENLNNNKITQTTNSQNNLEENQKQEENNEQNTNKLNDVKEIENTQKIDVNNTVNNDKNNTQQNEKNEENINKKNTTTNTFNQEETDSVNVLNNSKSNQSQNKKNNNRINTNNLIVKADKTLARNDDVSLNEEYKEIA